MTEPSLRSTFWNALQGTPYHIEWVDAGGIRTRTLQAGAQNDSPLLLVHGTGGHIENYIYNIGAHGERFRTIAFDLVGHGWSDHPLIDYEIATYVDHILRLLDALGIEKAHMSGQSLGGWVLARLAARYPDRVDRLVLNTAGGFSANRQVMDKARDLGRAAATGVPTSRDAVRKRLEFLVHEPASIAEEMVDVRHAIYSMPGYGEIMSRITCLQDPEIRARNLLTSEELEQIQARTLVVWTDYDPIAAEETGRALADLIPNSRFELIHGCAHWPQVERPERFNTLQIEFLTAPDASEGPIRD